MQNTIEVIKASKIIAIIRGVSSEHMVPLFDALYNGGIKIAEITMNTENALKNISQMRKNFDSKMIIGAGTVLNIEMAKKAIESGAQLIISPNLDIEVIEESLKRDVLPIPGVMTPTEMVQAMKYGAEVVKLFPAGDLGIGYIKNVLSPLNNAKIISVGGISKGNISDFIKAGSIGVGMGSNLINKEAISKNEFYKITEYALNLRELLK